MKPTTDEPNGKVGHGPGNDGGSALGRTLETLERRDELDSALMADSSAGREELLERICIDQVRRWRSGQRVPAETYLLRYPQLQSDDHAAFEMIYGEYLLREERGERPSAEELRWRFPRYVDRLRRQVDLHEVLNSADPGPRGGLVAPADPIDEDDDATESDGPVVAPGFRILGELGRGGMGTVYKARQVSLKRTVAIKVLRAGACADAATTARFQAEAEAAARFQHPNIIQVFEVGEHDGVGYLVLEYAPGGSLDRRLEQALQEPRSSAQLIATLARAIHFAHDHGIIHRDLKPANILLTEDGVPKIADFGLAKLLERDDALTGHGEILGTPSYMAPEQVRGLVDQINPATDVYSLGAILYEMLTGRPPFKGTTPLSTLEQVSSQEPLAPGKLQRHLPRDLETICLKCLEKESRRRYPTALALAEDLERFLHGKPILARPTPVWDRLAKWARRRPGGAAAAAALATLSLLLLGGGLYYNQQLHTEMLNAQDAERRADRNARSAGEQRMIALEHLNRLIFDVQEKLAPTPAMRSVRRALLDTAIHGLEEIERSTAGETANLSQAVAYEKLGDIYRVIGQTRAARQQYERSLRIAGNLLDAQPADVAIQAVLYQDHMGLGQIDMDVQDYEAAKVAFHQATNMAESIVDAEPDDRVARRDLIEAYLELGRSYGFARDYPRAEIWFRKMHDLAESWAAAEPGDTLPRDLLAAALRKLADLRKFDRDFAGARDAYGRAIAIGREIVAAEPANETYRFNLAVALDDLAGVANQQGRRDEARNLFGEAEDLLARLVADDPDNLERRIRLLHTTHHLALLDRTEARYAQARARLVRIRDQLRALTRDGALEGRSRPLFDDRELGELIDDCNRRLRTSG